MAATGAADAGATTEATAFDADVVAAAPGCLSHALSVSSPANRDEAKTVAAGLRIVFMIVGSGK